MQHELQSLLNCINQLLSISKKSNRGNFPLFFVILFVIIDIFKIKVKNFDV